MWVCTAKERIRYTLLEGKTLGVVNQAVASLSFYLSLSFPLRLSPSLSLSLSLTRSLSPSLSIYICSYIYTHMYICVYRYVLMLMSQKDAAWFTLHHRAGRDDVHMIGNVFKQLAKLGFMKHMSIGIAQ